MSRELCEQVRAVFHEAGCKTRIEHGGKHDRVVWTTPDGSERFHVVPVSESDWRATQNNVASAKKALRDAGLIGDGRPTETTLPIRLIDGRASCSSLDISERFGMEHKNVLRAIDKLRDEAGEEFDRLNFAPISYRDKSNREYRAFMLTRDAFSLVAMGFTGAEATRWKVRFIEAFNLMEREIAAITAPIAVSSEIDTVRADLEALTDLVLSLPSPNRGRVKRGPFVNPVFIIRQRRAQRFARGAVI